MQEEAEEVSFTFEVVGTYTVVCDGHSSASQNPKTFTNKVIGVVSEVATELRKNSSGQITGFKLSELGEEEVSGEGRPSAWTIEVSRMPNEDAGEVVGIVAHHPDEEDLQLETIILP